MSDPSYQEGCFDKESASHRRRVTLRRTAPITRRENLVKRLKIRVTDVQVERELRTCFYENLIGRRDACVLFHNVDSNRLKPGLLLRPCLKSKAILMSQLLGDLVQKRLKGHRRAEPNHVGLSARLVGEL